jgi:hypothetical protein
MDQNFSDDVMSLPEVYLVHSPASCAQLEDARRESPRNNPCGSWGLQTTLFYHRSTADAILDE